MNNGTQNTQMALARQEELVVKELPDEVLVYDLKRHKAHCLNKTAAFVWNQCDGQTTVSEMTSLLQQTVGEQVNEEVVWYTLDKLGNANLLAEKVTPPVEDAISRRRMVRRLGTMLILPTVVSIIAPAAVQAQTIVIFSKKIACGQCNQQDNPQDCISDTCCTGSGCTSDIRRGCVATGMPGTSPGLFDTSCSGMFCDAITSANPCSSGNQPQ